MALTERAGAPAAAPSGLSVPSGIRASHKLLCPSREMATR
jgi:hypothetical protein